MHDRIISRKAASEIEAAQIGEAALSVSAAVLGVTSLGLHPPPFIVWIRCLSDRHADQVDEAIKRAGMKASC